MTILRIPTHVLPQPEIRELPEAPPLRRMIGPSVILVGLSIGSGEFVLWPRLTAEWGFALFWACWIGVTLQYFINMEIERWTLATGESAVIGFVRLHRFYAPIFLVCATLPWIWPGWATGGATLLEWQLGLPIRATSIVGLVLCGLILSLGPVVYRTVETIQLVLVALIVVLLGGLSVAVVRADDVLALLAGAATVLGTIALGKLCLLFVTTWSFGLFVPFLALSAMLAMNVHSLRVLFSRNVRRYFR